MSNPPISQETMMNIVKKGIYYSPATKHYDSQSTNVVCDRCYKTHLDACYGLDIYDLCVSCVNSLRKFISINDLSLLNDPVQTRRMRGTADIDTIDDIKDCLIGSCNPPDSPRTKTLMEQRCYRKF